jgi:hypothetical protein
MVHLEMLPKCKCGGTYCAPVELVPESQRDQLDSCDGGLCVPKKLLLAGGNYVAPSCESIGGAEGRCQSICLPAIAAQAEMLSQVTCANRELCAPCYDPISGDDTHACNAAPCDTPKEEKYVFDYCFNDLGRCVPPELVDEADRKQLGQRTCDEGLLCAPNEFVENPDYMLPACDIDGEKAACVPEAVTAINIIRSTLRQRDCPENHLCTPCELNIFTLHISTGACDQ